MRNEDGSLVSKRLREILRRNVHHFDSGGNSRANELAEHQPANWNKVFSALQAKLGGEHLAAVIKIYKSVLQYLGRNPVKINPTDNEYNVVSGLPLITDEEANDANALIQGAPFAALAAVIEALAFPLWGSAGDSELSLDEGVVALLRDPRIVTSMAQNAAAREANKALKERDLNDEKIQRNVETFLSNSKSKEESINRRLMEMMNAYQNNITEYVSQKIKLEAEFDTFISDANAQILAARKQATESGILLNARTLWRNKARWHAGAFWAGLIVMAALIGGGIYWVVMSGPDFLAKLPKKVDGEIAYATVAMLTVCVIGAGWLLRFLGRFVTENMVMQSDASQREVMMRTYLALVGDENARMEQTDRTLILNAIFRPLPGHQSEDVAPPTLADVLKSATVKSGP